MVVAPSLWPTKEPRVSTDPADRIRELSRLPIWVAPMAGGPSTAGLVAAAARAGAFGILAGGYKTADAVRAEAALADSRRTITEVTRAFSGRPARALVNRFMRDHSDAPAAYPEINNATRPLRAAAAAAGDPDRMSLYAGQGFRAALDLEAAEIIGRLAAGVPR
jgi:nitronate monooxygenase